MVRNTRKIAWVKAALKDFRDFPQDAQDRAATALTMIADGATPDVAKPMSGLGIGDQSAGRRFSRDLRPATW